MFSISEVVNHLTHSKNGKERLIFLIKASAFTQDNIANFVSFTFTDKTKNHCNKIKISLENNLYNIEFGYLVGQSYKQKSFIKGIYHLKQYFEYETGLTVTC